MYPVSRCPLELSFGQPRGAAPTALTDRIRYLLSYRIGRIFISPPSKDLFRFPIDEIGKMRYTHAHEVNTKGFEQESKPVEASKRASEAEKRYDESGRTWPGSRAGDR